MNRESTPIPEPVAQLQRQLEQFRSTQPGRTKLPESLWQAAVELARQHGVYPVAHPLRLDYTRLKKAEKDCLRPRSGDTPKWLSNGPLNTLDRQTFSARHRKQPKMFRAAL